jgi:hypothetical protein
VSFIKHQPARVIVRPPAKPPPKTRTHPVCADEATIWPGRLSLAVCVNAEAHVLRETLESIFQQSLFEELHHRRKRCEFICIPSRCVDPAARVAPRVFAAQRAMHPFDSSFTCRVAEAAKSGRNSAWIGTPSPPISFRASSRRDVLSRLQERFVPAQAVFLPWQCWTIRNDKWSQRPLNMN